LPAALLGLLLLLPAANAHATCYTTGTGDCTTAAGAGSKVKIVYGNLNEPVSTFQKTGLDLILSDAKGKPMAGLNGADHDGMPVASPPIHVSLIYAGQTRDLTPCLKTQSSLDHSKDNAYTCPVIYTKPGAY